MIVKIAEYTAAFFVQKKWIEEERKQLYQLGIDVLLSTVFQTIVLLLIGLAIHNLEGVLLYLLIFHSVRKYSGGYHAGTRTGCLIVMVVSYVLSYYIPCMVFRFGMEQYYFVIAGICSNFIFWRWSPVKNEKKVLKEGWKPIARKKSICYMNLWLIFAVGCYCRFKQLSLQSVTTVFVIALLLLIRICERRTCNEGDSKKQLAESYVKGD